MIIQVYGAATLSVTSFREELGNSNMSIDSGSMDTHASVENEEPMTGVQFSKTINLMPKFFRSKNEGVTSFKEVPSKSRSKRSKKLSATFQDSPDFMEQQSTQLSFVSGGKRTNRRSVTDEREMKNVRIKKRLRLDSYHKNHNLRSQVINLNKKSGGILKRLVNAFDYYSESALIFLERNEIIFH